MKKVIYSLLSVVVIIAFIAACDNTKTVYVCPDGLQVSNLSLCKQTINPSQSSQQTSDINSVQKQSITPTLPDSSQNVSSTILVSGKNERAVIHFVGSTMSYSESTSEYVLPSVSLKIENTGSEVIKNPTINVVFIQKDANPIKRSIKTSFNLYTGDEKYVKLDLQDRYFSATDDAVNRKFPFKVVVELEGSNGPISNSTFYFQYMINKNGAVNRYSPERQIINKYLAFNQKYTMSLNNGKSSDSYFYIQIKNEDRASNFVLDQVCYFKDRSIDYSIAYTEFSIESGQTFGGFLVSRNSQYCDNVKLVLREADSSEKLAELLVPVYFDGLYTPDYFDKFSSLDNYYDPQKVSQEVYEP